MSQKLTREELRHDWLIDHSMTSWLWIRDHLAWVTGAVATVVLVIAVWAGITHHNASESREMDTVFAQADQEYQLGGYQAAAVAFDNFVNRFGGSPRAGEALLRGASAHLLSGSPKDAQPLFERYLRSHQGEDPFLDREARHGIAACLESTGDYAGAYDMYRQLADAAKNPPERAYHLKAAARCLEFQGKLDDAAKIYADLAQPSDSTPPDPEASQRLLEIRARQALAGDRTRPFSGTGS